MDVNTEDVAEYFGEMNPMERTTEKRNLSLYVHIPFCKAKCSYCDFLSFGNCSLNEQKQYVNALCREIAAYEAVAEDYGVKTIFIGGGTPSYIDVSLMERIMDTIYHTFQVDKDAEVTIEGNPDSLTKEKMVIYRKLGINRLSIGLQSANDEVLKTLDRVHNYDQFIASYNSARQAGFANINIDLMSGLPGETTESYIRTLAKVVKLQPEHISAYSLIVEDGTPLSDNEALLDLLPSEEEDRQLYAKTKMLLKNSGYDRYEISNYARKGMECRHNIVYWTGGEYLGVGLGASSYLKVFFSDGHMEPVRFHGVEKIEEYIGRFSLCEGMREDDYTSLYHAMEDEFFDTAYAEDESYEEYDTMYDMDMMPGMNLSAGSDRAQSNLEKYRGYENNVLLEFIRDYYRDLYFSKRKDEMEEFMFLGLRMMQGISKTEFKERFGTAVENIYGNIIEKYKKRTLLQESEDRLYLTDAGIDVSNVVMAEFMLT